MLAYAHFFCQLSLSLSNEPVIGIHIANPVRKFSATKKYLFEAKTLCAHFLQDLNQLKAFGGVEGVQVSLSVCRWQEQVASYPGMEFRGFVYKVFV